MTDLEGRKEIDGCTTCDWNETHNVGRAARLDETNKSKSTRRTFNVKCIVAIAIFIVAIMALAGSNEEFSRGTFKVASYGAAMSETLTKLENLISFYLEGGDNDDGNFINYRFLQQNDSAFQQGIKQKGNAYLANSTGGKWAVSWVILPNGSKVENWTFTPKVTTYSPSSSPSVARTQAPTFGSPTMSPSTQSPTATPTAKPTAIPTATPTSFPTSKPTVRPSPSPIISPTIMPSAGPTIAAPTVSRIIYTQQKIVIALGSSKNSSALRRMLLTESAISTFETIAKDFLEGDILSAINLTYVIVSPNQNGRRVLQQAGTNNGTSPLVMYTTIAGHYNTQKEIPKSQFNNMASSAFNDQGNVFVSKLVSSGAPAYKDAIGVSSTSVSFPLPPQVAALLANSQDFAAMQRVATKSAWDAAKPWLIAVYVIAGSVIVVALAVIVRKRKRKNGRAESSSDWEVKEVGKNDRVEDFDCVFEANATHCGYDNSWEYNNVPIQKENLQRVQKSQPKSCKVSEQYFLSTGSSVEMMSPTASSMSSSEDDFEKRDGNRPNVYT